MKPGDVVLTVMPQADDVQKVRPALLLCFVPPFNDCLVCGISTQLHQAAPDFDEIVSLTDEDFHTSGLQSPSLIRLGFLASRSRRQIPGVLGAIRDARLRRLRERLARHLQGSFRGSAA